MNSDFIQSVGQLRSPVATYSDLIALVDDNVVGDMRIVLDTGDAYVWSGSISPITHTQWFKATTSYYNDLHGSPSLSGLDIDNAVKMVPSLAANVALLAYNMIVTGMESITRLFDGMVNKFLDEVGINTAASTNELYTSNEYYKPDLSSAPEPVSSVIEDSSGLDHVIDVHGGAVASGANPLIGNASLVLDGIDSYLSSPSTAEMVPGTIDAYTKLLLHLDNNLTDSATGKIVGDGGVTFSSSVKKFGSHALSFNGSSYIAVPYSTDFNFADQPFTIDLWANFNTSSPASYLVGQNNQGTLAADFDAIGGLLYIYVRDAAGLRIYMSADFTPTPGVWYHLALVRIDNGNSANSWRIFINGISQTLTLRGGSWNASYPNHTTPLLIGSEIDGYFHNGYMDEIRISKGIARWTENFTPSSTAYPLDVLSDSDWRLSNAALSDYTVDFWINPKSLEDLNTYLIGVEDSWKLTLDGVMTASSITDETGKTVNVLGDIVLSTTKKKFGNASIASIGIPYDTGTHELVIPSSTDFDFGTDPFTIDFWVNFTNADNKSAMLIRRAQGAPGIYFTYEANRLYLSDQVTSEAYCPFVNEANVWYHLALVRVNDTNSASAWRIFINGVSQPLTLSAGSWNFSYPAVSKDLKIATLYHLDGYMDEIRISKGIARWTENFTPPTAPYTVDANTKLLIHADATISKYLKYSVIGGNSMVAPIALALDTWQHLAVVQNAGTAKLYVNGVLGASMVGSATPNSATALSIGASSTGTHLVDGLMEEVRISKGIARWVAPFTPEAIAYTTDANTTLLLDFNVETVSNMVLKSEGFISNYVPTSARVVIFEEDVDTVLPNVDLKVEVSRDAGATFSLATLTKGQDFGNGTLNLFTGEADLAAQPNGNVIVYRLTTMNNKDCKIKGVSVTWR